MQTPWRRRSETGTAGGGRKETWESGFHEGEDELSRMVVPPRAGGDEGRMSPWVGLQNAPGDREAEAGAVGALREKNESRYPVAHFLRNPGAGVGDIERHATPGSTRR